MIKNILTVVFLVVYALSANAEKAPMKFGKVSQEELKMKVYEQDTSAAAVVLCKYGYFNSNDYCYTLVKRIKVLKKSGTYLAEAVFPGGDDVVIRGKVFNLENGEIVTSKLKHESIFEERVSSNYSRYRVALPNVKVGTVFDIEYTKFLLPSEFSFQETVPVKHAELVLEETEIIDYRKRSVGYLPIEKTGSNTYVSKNLPAFKEEAFIDSKENYITKIEFDILSIHIPSRNIYKAYTTTWEAVNKILEKNDYFIGAVLNGSGYLSDIKNNIESSCNTPLAKLEAAYNTIKSVKWNNRYSAFTSVQSLSTAYKNNTANSADINLMLLQLLKKLDIEAYPVVLSTRSNGVLNQFFPSLEKLNYTIVAAYINDKEYLMDATADFMPLGMLPKRCLNHHGRLIDDNSGRWIPINTSKKEKDITLYRLALQEDFSLEGTLECSSYDYEAYNLRSRYHRFSSEEEFLSDLEKNIDGIRILESKITNIDSLNLPVKEYYKVKLNTGVQKVGDIVTINPFFFSKLSENPLKMEKRDYPVDYAYKCDRKMITQIEIPAEYTIDQIPEPVRIILPNKGAAVTINYNSVGNKVNVIYQFKINKSMFLPDEYELLKQLYALIIEKHAEPIILKQNSNVAEL